MADLRAVVERLGYRDVRTLLNSGNVVFTTRASPSTAANRIEREIEKQLGVSAKVIVLTGRELEQIVAENSLAARADNPSRLLVAVFATAEQRASLNRLKPDQDGNVALAIGTRAAYLWCPDGILASPLVEIVMRSLGHATTTRNWATILKLRAALKLSAPERAS
jgi:uncharacterized protein (DUF1697 family)